MNKENKKKNKNKNKNENNQNNHNYNYYKKTGILMNHISWRYTEKRNNKKR
jgi:hypothetical protein